MIWRTRFKSTSLPSFGGCSRGPFSIGRSRSLRRRTQTTKEICRFRSNNVGLRAGSHCCSFSVLPSFLWTLSRARSSIGWLLSVVLGLRSGKHPLGTRKSIGFTLSRPFSPSELSTSFVRRRNSSGLLGRLFLGRRLFLLPLGGGGSIIQDLLGQVSDSLPALFYESWQ